MRDPSYKVILATMLALSSGSPWLSLGEFRDVAWAAPAKKLKLQPGLGKLYARGQELFEEKKFDAALESLNQLLQRQPDFAPAKLLAARCLYQLRRSPEAFKIFQQVDTGLFDAPAFYEAGQTAYSLNQFAAAVRFFEEVPEGHPLYDMAGYYGGIAAFKSADYSNAIDLLEQAVVLPSKLVRTQQIFRREAERLENQKQKAESGESKSSSVSSEKSANLALPAPALEDGHGERSFRSLRPIRSIALLPRTTFQKQESERGRINEYAINTEEIRLKMGFSHEDSARSPHYVLQADTAFWGVQGSSKEIPLFAPVRREQEFYIIRKEAPKTVAFIEGDAGIEWPVHDQHSLGLHLGLYTHIPNHYEVSNCFSPWGSLFYAYQGSFVEAQLSAAAHARFEDEHFLFLTNVQEAQLAFMLPSDFRLQLQAELFEYVYEEKDAAGEPIDGPDWTGRGTAEIGYQKGTFLGIFVGGVYESSKNVRKYLPDASSLEYDRSTQGLRARAELGLAKWLRVGGSWLAVEREATLRSGSVDELAATFVPTITEFTGHITLFDTF